MIEAEDDHVGFIAFVWSVFWRFVVASTVIVTAVSFILGSLTWIVWGFVATSREMAGTLPGWLLITLNVVLGVIYLIVAFATLHWAIKSRLGKRTGAVTLELVRTAHDRAS